jgi:hypothetical protein
MIDTLAIGIVLGLFAGLAIASLGFIVYLHFQSQKQINLVDRERKLLINKAFVRDGQSRIFPDAIVNDGLETQPAEKPAAPSRSISPFRKGKVELQEKLAKGATAEMDEPGASLPDAVKEQIAEAARKAQEKAA